MFGLKSKTSSAPPIWKTPWVHGLLVFCGVLLALAALIETYRVVDRYANRVVKDQPVPARIELKNTPRWLDRSIVSGILKEAQDFATHDDPTRLRILNPLDKSVLDDLRANYSANLSRNANAWLKSITKIQRVLDRKQNVQTIEIYAEYRRPVAWVGIPFRGDARITDLKFASDPIRLLDPQNQSHIAYYLIDEEFVQLPGVYDANDVAHINFLKLYGIDQNPPGPGAAFTVPELSAGMQLLKKLETQPFAHQISLINLSNYNSRLAPLEPQIVLNTVFGSRILWGRPIGSEKFWDISAGAKIKTLLGLFAQFNRIDAQRDAVDIHTEQIRVPKLAAQIPDAPPPVSAHG